MFNRVLIVGVGDDPYRCLFHHTKQYIRFDIKPIKCVTDVVGDALSLPFEANRFDCIFASEVLEHLSDPFLFVREVSRVLKLGGMIILTVPFMFHKHADPHDFWRPTEQGLEELFKCFEEVEVRSYGNSLHVISDILTMVFSPYPVLFPLRIINNLVRVLPVKRINSFPSMAPSGYLVIATK